MTRAISLLMAASLLACGGQPEPRYQPPPETQQPTKFLMECWLTLPCYSPNLEPWVLTKPGGTYCTAYNSEAKTKAMALCADKPKGCSCSASCAVTTRCL